MDSKTISALALLPFLISPSTYADELRVGTIFSSEQSASQSFLRFYNSGTDAGTATVTLKDFTSGETLGQWTSPSVPSGVEAQYQIGTVESESGASFTTPQFYTIVVEPTFSGSFQHVLFRPADGTLTNLSTCAGGATTTTSNTLIAVHTSILDNGYPSTVAVTNTGSTAATAELTIYDAQDGTDLGTYTTESIAADGQLLLQVSTIEAALSLTPSSSTFHYNIRLTSDLDGYLQNLVDNQSVGVITDMSAVCTLTASTSSTTTAFEGAVSGSSESGSLALTIDTDVQSSSSAAQVLESSSQVAVSGTASAGREREGQSAVSTATGTFTPQGGSAVSLTGTYDSDTQRVSVSGSGYTFSGDIEAAEGGEPQFSGEYSSASSSGRVIAPRRTALSRPQSYCGGLTIDNEEGSASATFNFSTSGSKVTGTYSDPEGGSGRIKGTLSGRQITANTFDYGRSSANADVSIVINDNGSFSGSFAGRGRDATDVGPITGSEC